MDSQDRPLCKCHDEPMVWNKNKRYKAGGHWRCLIKRREAGRLYSQTEKGHEARRRYNQTEKRRETRNRFSRSEKGREAQRRYRRRKKEQGLCTHCGKEPLLSEVHCWGCLNKLEEYGLLRIQ